MPYKIRKLPNKNKYRVYNSDTGVIHAHSTTLENAKSQLRLLYMIENKTGTGAAIQRALGRTRIRDEPENFLQVIPQPDIQMNQVVPLIPEPEVDDNNTEDEDERILQQLEDVDDEEEIDFRSVAEEIRREDKRILQELGDITNKQLKDIEIFNDVKLDLESKKVNLFLQEDYDAEEEYDLNEQLDIIDDMIEETIQSQQNNARLYNRKYDEYISKYGRI